MLKQLTYTDMTLPPPDKQDIELEVSGLFHNGDIGNVARYVQRDKGLVSKLLSANCEDKNHVVYFFLLFLWAFDTVRRELGDAVIEIVLRERAKWLNESPQVITSPARMTRQIGEELFEAVEAEMLDKSWDEQIKEWSDVERAAREKKLAVIERRNERHFGKPSLAPPAEVRTFKNGGK